MEGKVRPALVVSVGYGDVDRALIAILPHTTSLRGSQYEIAVNVPFLEDWRVPVAERSDLSERKGDSEIGDAQIRSVQVVFAGLLRWLGDVRS
jgi:mRNA interferase MazF